MIANVFGAYSEIYLRYDKCFRDHGLTRLIRSWVGWERQCATRRRVAEHTTVRSGRPVSWRGEPGAGATGRSGEGEAVAGSGGVASRGGSWARGEMI